ncbi:hypothetical protein [Vibrio paucivorans]
MKRTTLFAAVALIAVPTLAVAGMNMMHEHSGTRMMSAMMGAGDMQHMMTTMNNSECMQNMMSKMDDPQAKAQMQHMMEQSGSMNKAMQQSAMAEEMGCELNAHGS